MLQVTQSLSTEGRLNLRQGSKKNGLENIPKPFYDIINFLRTSDVHKNC